MLIVKGLCASYGKSRILTNLDFSIGDGEVLAIVGRNGAGRSTAARALVGRVERSGSIQFQGQELIAARSHEIALLGIAYVPENREVFGQLNVEENLRLGSQTKIPRSLRSAWDIDRAYALFPRLRERRHAPAGALSGGEQQMLVLCRALMGNPDLLIIDEPTEGLSPQMVDLVASTIVDLKAEGLSMLLIEQKLDIALDVSDRAIVLGGGEAVFSGTVEELKARQDVIANWVGLS